MPVSCATSVLTGQEGSLWFKPAGTKFCLQDLADFPSGESFVTVPVQQDFRPGDPVKFTEQNGGNLDSALTAGQTYWIGLVQPTRVQVLASAGGSAVVFNGDGGAAAAGRGAILTFGTIVPGSGYVDGSYTNVSVSGGSGSGAKVDVTVSGGAVTAVDLNAGAGSGGIEYAAGDVVTVALALLGGTGAGFQVEVDTITPLPTDTPGGHIQIEYNDFESVANVTSFTLNLTRDQLETTSLPTGVGRSQGKYAAFRTRQSGYADGTGTMEVQFTQDAESMSARLRSNSMLRSQDGASTRLFYNTVSDGSTVNPMPDLAASDYFEAPISIEGFDTSVTPDDPTTATLNFSVSGTPLHIGRIDL